jgi:hypothetical protein
MSFRCFLPAWIAAWVTAVFVPSALIAYLGLSNAAASVGTGFHRLPASTWKVADDVGPLVKLMLGGLLFVCLLGLGRMHSLSRGARYSGSVAIGVIAVAVIIALVPATFSRGFAVALTGTRFDPLTTPIYLLGGALSGLSFMLGLERCSRGSARRGTSASPEQ